MPKDRTGTVVSPASPVAVMPRPIADSASHLRSLIAAELPSLIAFRHDLHRHPELSFQEKRTSEVVQRELKALGIAFKAGLGGGTGIAAHLPATEANGAHKPAIALRADMDALPIVEETGKPYASATPGVMHACGHDGHTTILLGAARVLSKLPRPNPVTFFFQPAEENEGGGKIMCQEGVLKGDKGAGIGPEVARIFGLHGWPQLPLNTIATRPGPLMAAVDDFTLTIRGTQSHGAYPHLSRDPIVTAAHVITAIQTIASRNVAPVDALVVTVGKIEGGTANNIIPQQVTLIGTVRTLNDKTKALARERFVAIVRHTCEAMGCEAKLDYHEGYPVTANDPALTESFFDLAREVAPASTVVRLEEPTMGGEDFSFYGKHVPAVFFFLGLRPRGAAAGEYPSLHQPKFDFNDDAIPLGVEMLCRLATTM
jgi:amidohydrolase